MKKLLVVIAVLLGTVYALAQTGTSKTKSQLSTEINANLPNNTSGQITPFTVRQTMQDMVASWLQTSGAVLAGHCAGFDSSGNIVDAGGPCTAVQFATPNRPVLTGTPTFYVATTGSDATGDGSVLNPWGTGTTAYFIVASTYDFGTTTPVIQFQDGTYNTADNSQIFMGIQPVGGSGLTFQGNAANPGNVIFDGTAQGAGGLGISIAANYRFFFGGMTFQNFDFAAFGNQAAASEVNIVSPIVLKGGGEIDFDMEAGGALLCAEGTTLATITVSGTHQQLAYIAHKSSMDLNNCPVVFSGTPNFTGEIFNVDSFGFAFLHNTFSGAVTGVKYVLSGGGTIQYTNATESGAEPPSRLPGSITGTTVAGWFNNSFGTSPVTIASLPTGSSGGTRLMVSDATTTVFNTTITAGGGTNIMPVFHDGTNWRIGG